MRLFKYFGILNFVCWCLFVLFVLWFTGLIELIVFDRCCFGLCFVLGFVCFIVRLIWVCLRFDFWCLIPSLCILECLFFVWIVACCDACVVLWFDYLCLVVSCYGVDLMFSCCARFCCLVCWFDVWLFVLRLMVGLIFI